MAPKRQAEDQAGKVLHELGLEGVIPVPVERIVRALGASLQRRPGLAVPTEGEVSGMLVRTETGSYLFVNSSHVEARQRFTIAHEIGHLVLHKPSVGEAWIDVNLRGSKSSIGTDIQEIEANAFAAALLMPETAVRGWLATHASDLNGLTVPFSEPEIECLRALAKHFEVSLDAMTFRLVNLGLAKTG